MITEIETYLQDLKERTGWIPRAIVLSRRDFKIVQREIRLLPSSRTMALGRGRAVSVTLNAGTVILLDEAETLHWSPG